MIQRTYVYVVRLDGYVKIGVSNCPARRIEEVTDRASKLLRPENIDLDMPVEAVGAFVGDAATENALHLMFTDEHAIGEWFRDEGRLWTWCNRLRHVAAFQTPFALNPDAVRQHSSIQRLANDLDRRADAAERRIVELTGAVEAWRSAAAIVAEQPDPELIDL